MSCSLQIAQGVDEGLPYRACWVKSWLFSIVAWQARPGGMAAQLCPSFSSDHVYLKPYYSLNFLFYVTLEMRTKSKHGHSESGRCLFIAKQKQKKYFNRALINTMNIPHKECSLMAELSQWQRENSVCKWGLT